MNRLDRLQAILIQLQSKKIVKAQEVADRFDISLRTVYRDIRSLEESGVPIGAEAGVGYFLMDNYSLPPIMFTHEEASALLFGEKLMEQMSDESMKQNFVSSIYKIKAILKPSEKEHLEKLYNTVAVFNRNSRNGESNSLFLSEIQQSLANKQVLNILYKSKKDDTPQERSVEPIGLCNYATRWHLFAWCRLREDYRDFRLDRISSLEVTPEKFDDKRLISLDEFLKTIDVDSNSQANITLLVDNDKREYFDESKYWYGFLQESEAGDKVRMSFFNTDLRGFASWLLNTGSFATVESPSELVEIIRTFVTNAYNAYVNK